MSWLRRITGFGYSAALAGVDGALSDVSAAELLERLTSRTPELYLDTEMRSQEDDMGCGLNFEFSAAMPQGALAMVDVLDHEGRAVLSNDDLFADSDGHFMDAAEVRDRRCRAFIPYGVLAYERAGRYSIRLRCVWYEAEYDKIHEFGSARYRYSFPAPTRSWTRIEFARPLVWLGMILSRADHDVAQSEVRQLFRTLSDVVGIGPKDILKVRQVMLERPSRSLADIIDLVMTRFGQLSPTDLIGFLGKLAWSSGRIDEREVEVIRKAATHLGLGYEEWRAIVRKERRAARRRQHKR